MTMLNYTGKSPYESSSTLKSQSQNHSQNRRIRVPQTVAHGIFDRQFDFDSQEWICSNGVPCRSIRRNYVNVCL